MLPTFFLHKRLLLILIGIFIVLIGAVTLILSSRPQADPSIIRCSRTISPPLQPERGDRSEVRSWTCNVLEWAGTPNAASPRCLPEIGAHCDLGSSATVDYGCDRTDTQNVHCNWSKNSLGTDLPPPPPNTDVYCKVTTAEPGCRTTIGKGQAVCIYGRTITCDWEGTRESGGSGGGKEGALDVIMTKAETRVAMSSVSCRPRARQIVLEKDEKGQPKHVRCFFPEDLIGAGDDGKPVYVSAVEAATFRNTGERSVFDLQEAKEPKDDPNNNQKPVVEFKVTTAPNPSPSPSPSPSPEPEACLPSKDLTDYEEGEPIEEYPEDTDQEFTYQPERKVTAPVLLPLALAQASVNPADYAYIRQDQNFVYNALAQKSEIKNVQKNEIMETLAEEGYFSAYSEKQKKRIIDRITQNGTKNKAFIVVLDAERTNPSGAWPAVRTINKVIRRGVNDFVYRYPKDRRAKQYLKQLPVPTQVEILASTQVYGRLKGDVWRDKKNWTDEELDWAYNYWLPENAIGGRKQPEWTIEEKDKDLFNFFFAYGNEERPLKDLSGHLVKELGIGKATSYIPIGKLFRGTVKLAKKIPPLARAITLIEIGFRRFVVPVARGAYKVCFDRARIFANSTRDLISIPVQRVAIKRMEEGIQMINQVPLFRGLLSRGITEGIASKIQVLPRTGGLPLQSSFCTVFHKSKGTGVRSFEINEKLLTQDPIGRHLQQEFIHGSIHVYSKTTEQLIGDSALWGALADDAGAYFTRHTYKVFNRIPPCHFRSSESGMVSYEMGKVSEAIVKAIARGLSKDGGQQTSEKALHKFATLYFRDGLVSGKYKLSKLLGHWPKNVPRRYSEVDGTTMDAVDVILDTLYKFNSTDKSSKAAIGFINKLNR